MDKEIKRQFLQLLQYYHSQIEITTRDTVDTVTLKVKSMLDDIKLGGKISNYKNLTVRQSGNEFRVKFDVTATEGFDVSVAIALT